MSPHTDGGRGQAAAASPASASHVMTGGSGAAGCGEAQGSPLELPVALLADCANVCVVVVVPPPVPVRPPLPVLVEVWVVVAEVVLEPSLLHAHEASASAVPIDNAIARGKIRISMKSTSER